MEVLYIPMSNPVRHTISFHHSFATYFQQVSYYLDGTYFAHCGNIATYTFSDSLQKIVLDNLSITMSDGFPEMSPKRNFNFFITSCTLFPWFDLFSFDIHVYWCSVLTVLQCFSFAFMIWWPFTHKCSSHYPIAINSWISPATFWRNPGVNSSRKFFVCFWCLHLMCKTF